jgi:hypothetical protein
MRKGGLQAVGSKEQ